MVEPTIPVNNSGDAGQHSHWNVMRIKVQDTTDGHRHDGVGSFGPLTAFSAAAFTNVSANALFVGSTVNLLGPVNLSGNLGVINLSASGTATVVGNASFGGNLVLQSAFTANIINAPGNLSASGIVSQLVAGSNITISGAGGTGVVAVGVAGTTVFTGTNQSFGTVVQGSTLIRNTLVISGQSNVAAVVLDNASSTGSLYVQSRVTANDSVFLANVSANSAVITGTLAVGGLTSLSGNMVLANFSANAEVIGSSQLGTLTLTSTEIFSNTNTSAGNLHLFNWSAGRTYIALNETNASAVPDVAGLAGWFTFYDVQGTPQYAVQLSPSSGTINTVVSITSGGAVVGGNLSAAGSVQIQSRMQANDASITGNFSSGSVFVGSAQFTNISTNTLVTASAQIGVLTNVSSLIQSNVNTSAGNFRFFQLSAGRTFQTLNAQNQNALPDVSGLPQWLHYFDNASATTQVVWSLAPSSGTQNTIVTLYSSGLAVTLNVSAGSLTIGSGIATQISTNRLVTASGTINWLVNTSQFIIPNMSTNQSAGNFRIFGLSSGRTYMALNTTNASAVPDVSGNPMLIQFYDNLSGTPAQYGWQIAPTSGTINSYMTLTQAALTISTGVRYIIRTVTVSTNSSANDYLIVVNQSSANEAVSLARAQSSIGQKLHVYAMSGLGTVTVFATSTDQIGFTGGSSLTVANETVARIMGVNNSTFIQV